jgi:hypothetical protein
MGIYKCRTSDEPGGMAREKHLLPGFLRRNGLKASLPFHPVQVVARDPR